MNNTGVRHMCRQALPGVLAFCAMLGCFALSFRHSSAQPLKVQTEQHNRPYTSPPPVVASVAEPAKPMAELSPHIFAVPSLDGTELFIQADKLPLATGRFYANVSVGPGHEKDAWTMTYSTTQIALTSTALGFTPLESAYGSMNITGTLSGVTYSTNELEFNRAFVPMSDKLISEWSPDGLVELQIASGSITHDTYLVMMSSFAPPGAPAPGISLASPSYSIRLADPLPQIESPVLLRFYLNGLPVASTDWHSLLINRWDVNQDRWIEQGTHLNTTNGYLWSQVDRLTEYAVTLAPIWLDEFDDLSGVESGQSNPIEIVGTDGDRGVALSAGVLTGTVTSKPYTLAMPGPHWVTVYFAGLANPPAADFTVNLLAESGAVIAAGIKNGDTVAVDTRFYPALRLQARLDRVAAAASPVLYRWRLNEEPARRLFLPMVEH